MAAGVEKVSGGLQSQVFLCGLLGCCHSFLFIFILFCLGVGKS